MNRILVVSLLSFGLIATLVPTVMAGGIPEIVQPGVNCNGPAGLCLPPCGGTVSVLCTPPDGYFTNKTWCIAWVNDLPGDKCI